ncbi:hypothetical protein [Streptomyces triticisoli]|jgi:hypothetical protein|uniref:hypothetical protein n=1 Tax=Streptomyces triticisoli TaxID=2182797 RepID=UPI0013005063|nr:hypothetical protein [Streptomyces triticisoli]
MQMIRKTIVAILLLAAGTFGCAEQNGAAADGLKACDGATYEWSHEARWVPIVLDHARTVTHGDELKMAGDPYRPWSSTITLNQDVRPPNGILSELSRELGKPLADFGRNTKSEAIAMTTGFEGDEAQAVYFQGVERIDAKFTLKCSGRDRPITGNISTWNTDSNSFGTVDCLKSLSANPDNPLAKVAATKRCPKDSVLAQEAAAQ